MELLELHNITKRYPGVIALNNVSISFREGEVHALVGENGAGKSTFIKTISGAVQPNEGEIVFDGVTYDHLTPQKSLELGISVVYQEMIQFEAMSVADNLFMSDGSERSFWRNSSAIFPQEPGSEISPWRTARSWRFAKQFSEMLVF